MSQLAPSYPVHTAIKLRTRVIAWSSALVLMGGVVIATTIDNDDNGSSSTSASSSTLVGSPSPGTADAIGQAFRRQPGSVAQATGSTPPSYNPNHH